MRRRTSIGSTLGRVEIVPVVREAAPHLGADDQVVHAVERAQQRALAAARRSDQRGDPMAGDVERDALDRDVAGVEDGDVARLEHDLVRLGLRRPALVVLGHVECDRWRRHWVTWGIGGWGHVDLSGQMAPKFQHRRWAVSPPSFRVAMVETATGEIVRYRWPRGERAVNSAEAGPRCRSCWGQTRRHGHQRRHRRSRRPGGRSTSSCRRSAPRS